MNIYCINDRRWEIYLDQSPYRTPFHSTNLIRCFTSVLGGDFSLFFVENGARSWLIPIFTGEPWRKDIMEFATSSVGYGGPLPLQTVKEVQDEIQDMFLILSELENTVGKKFTKGILPPIQEWEYESGNDFSETMLVYLRKDGSETFQEILTGNARTAIRKALRFGLQARKTNKNEDILVAHNLICNTQMSVGASYTTPLSLVRSVLSSADAELHVVSVDEKIVSAGVLIVGKTHNFHWLHGWDRNYTDVCGNQLLIWSMMQSCISRESFVFNMGACHSVFQKKAKEKWGAQPVSVLHIKGEAGEKINNE